MLKGKHQLHFSLCGSQKYESQYEVIQKKPKTLKSLSVKAFKLLEKKKRGGGGKTCQPSNVATEATRNSY